VALKAYEDTMASAVGDAPRGYDKELIKGNLDVKYQCSFCRYLLKNPIQSFCGHRFCKDCIEYLVRDSDSVVCPSCKEEGAENEYSTLQLDQTFPDNAIKREFANLEAHCTNPGCDWTGPFKNYAKHEEECAFKTLPCKYCKIQVKVTEMENHYQECPEFPLVCDVCGKEGIPRKDMARHQDPASKECVKPTYPCEYGCGETLETDRLLIHNNENVIKHMGLLMKKVQTVSAILEGMQSNGYVTTSTSSANQAVMSDMADSIPVSSTTENHKVSEKEKSLKNSDVTYDAHEVGRNVEMHHKSIVTFENILSVLTKEIDKCLTRIEKLEEDNVNKGSGAAGASSEAIENLDKKVKTLERTVAMKDLTIAEQELRLLTLEQTSYDGVLLWRIDDFNRRRHDALTGKVTSIYSPAFYTSRTGYKMCARVYLNGDGMGKGTHVSLFFVVMRGNFDALLRWPFRQKVTLMLIDQNQRENIIDAFRPDPNSGSFKRPNSDMNIASGCPLFAPLTQLENPHHAYVKDDAIFIKIIVDCGDIGKT